MNLLILKLYIYIYKEVHGEKRYVRSYTGLRGERYISYKSMETSPSKMRCKIVRLTTIQNGSKRTISASGRLELLQMISKLNTGACVSEEAGPQGEWIVRSHIDWRGERNIPY